MKVIYRTMFASTCPRDETVTDIYELSVVMEDSWLPVETILAAIKDVTDGPAYQEEITERLSQLLGEGVTVETVGTHSGVLTTVTT